MLEKINEGEAEFLNPGNRAKTDDEKKRSISGGFWWEIEKINVTIILQVHIIIDFRQRWVKIKLSKRNSYSFNNRRDRCLLLICCCGFFFIF